MTLIFVETPHLSSAAAGILLRRQLRREAEGKMGGWRGRIRWRDGIVQKIIDSGLPLICEFCGRGGLVPFPEQGDRNALTLDHFIPFSKSRNNCLTNLVMACVKCNSTKSDRYPTDEEKNRVRNIEFLLNSAGQVKTI